MSDRKPSGGEMWLAFVVAIATLGAAAVVGTLVARVCVAIWRMP